MRPTLLAGVCVLLTAAVVTGQTANATVASPFGLRMGLTRDMVGIIDEEVAPYKFLLNSVPKPDPDLAIYTVTVTPKAGLCTVRSMSPNVQTTAFGTELKSRFDRMVSQLAEVHGRPSVLNTLVRGSVLNEPKDWMASLLKKDRALFAMWSSENFLQTSALARVTVSANALSETRGYLAVQYYFSNYDQCQAEIAGSERSAS